MAQSLTAELLSSNYMIADTSEIVSPGIVLFYDVIERNLSQMVAIAGAASRLRTHCKTHKMSEVSKIHLDHGITKFKAATFAEAEMLAEAGVRDVVLAYNVVGPNIARTVQFVQAFPNVSFAVTADHAKPISELGQALVEANQQVDVLLDMDAGMHRTGVSPGPKALDLYRQLVETGGVEPGGLHVYDGHNHHADIVDRRAAGLACWNAMSKFRDELVGHGWPVPRMVLGGTGTFPVYAEIDDEAIELSPGTCVFQDVGYMEKFCDLQFEPAALLLTRVISRPTQERVTLDLGYKAVASDPPLDRRVSFLDVPDAKLVLQNEEHLVIETSQAEKYHPGDELLAIPFHICPTTALHKFVYVIRDGRMRERWDVLSRDRIITI